MNAMVQTVRVDWQKALLSNREKALEKLYSRTYPMVLHYVKLRGGSAEDAQDLLQDAIILFYEKIIHDQLILTSAASTYLMGICKNHWRRLQEKRSQRTELSPEEFGNGREEPVTESQVPDKQLMDYVEQLGEKCRQLLVNFYYFGQRIDQIAAGQGYRNLHTTSVQKYKCLERLRKAVSHLTIHHFN